MSEKNSIADNKQEASDRVSATNNVGVNKKVKAARAPTSKLAVLSLVLVIALGGGVYYHGHKQAALQQQTINQLQTQLLALQQKIDLSTDLQQTVNQLSQQVTPLQQEQKALQKTVLTNQNSLTAFENGLQTLQEKVSALSVTDNSTWLISQADYLVKLAGRKIWNDQDFVTARLLLKSADASIAEINDPSLLPLRSALNEDINSLTNIANIDFDGIILRLNQLANQIIELTVADTIAENGNNTDYYDDTEHDNDQPAENKAVSESISDWKQNLAKNWHAFTAQFVTIKKRNNLTECLANAKTDQAVKACSNLAPLLLPEQDVYLRENLRMQLFIAAQAVPRHQYAIYQQSLDNVATWVRAYFDTTNPITQTFLDDIDHLSQQSFNMDIPDQLKSSQILDKLMQTRVRNLLTQPVNNNLGG